VKYIRKLLLLTALFFLFSSLYAQEYDPYTYQEKEPKKVLSEKVFFGGSFGLQFGTYTIITLTPEAGYRVSPNFEFGPGAYYMFFYNSLSDYRDHVYGPKVFARVFVYNDIYIQGEYEYLNVPDYTALSGYSGNRVFIPGFLGGLGYRQKVGSRSAIMATVLWNFMITEKTPYYNPVVRFSFLF
jgi:hypothetical protein